MSFGYHIHKYGREMKDAIREELARATRFGVSMRTFQLFVMGPRNARMTLTDDDKEYIRVLSGEGYRVIVHGSYLDNPWGSKPKAALHFIKSELKVCGELLAYGMIIHLPRRPVSEVVYVVKEILDFKRKNGLDDVVLYLEVGSVRSSEMTYETPEKIACLFVELGKYGDVGFCVDTAHLWAAGVDISTRELAEAWIGKYKKIGIKETTIALNDQVTGLGAGKDEHAPLTYGTIYSEYNNETGSKPISESGLSAFLDWSLQEDIPVILERKSDKPKINGKPLIDNVESDLMVIYQAGYYRL